MSERTLCNFCTLQRIKQQYPGKEVVVLKTGELICNLQVYVEGKPLGVWFAAISDYCVCYGDNNNGRAQ